MDDALAGFLRRLYQDGRDHDGPLPDRLARLRNMTPAAASLISLAIRVQRSRHVLEIGTSNGYSAIWFGDAVRDVGGRLTTVETEADRVAQARSNLEAAGVAAYVEVVHGDGADVLAAAGDGSVDLVVLDAERPAYPTYWAQLGRVLSRYGVVAVDNAVSHREQVADFVALVSEAKGFAVQLHEIGDGVLTVVRVE